MIRYLDSVVDGAHTEGFKTSISGSSLQVEAGTLTQTRTKKDTGEEESRVKSFPAFTFDTAADPAFAVLYDVYLMEDETVHIDRTVLAPGVMPAYDGSGTIFHTLMSFELPPNGDLSQIDIEVRTLKEAVPE